MNLTLAIQALGIILDLAEAVTTNATAKKIIVYAEAVLPILIQDAAAEVPVVKQLLVILKGNAVMTPADIGATDALIAQTDADFDAATVDFNKRAHPNG